MFEPLKVRMTELRGVMLNGKGSFYSSSNLKLTFESNRERDKLSCTLSVINRSGMVGELSLRYSRSSHY